MYRETVMLRVSGLRVGLEDSAAALKAKTAKRLGVPAGDIESITLVKRAVDARDKRDVFFSCSVDVSLGRGERRLLTKFRDNRVQKAEPAAYRLPDAKPLRRRPVVIGFGPAGMFAALILAKCGQNPIVLERGLPVDERQESVGRFWESGQLDADSNVQFGEGGAGTFSDGKLTTGTKDPRIRQVLQEFAAAGAPEEILYDAKPHIGTDRLRGVVKSIRETVIGLGGDVRFGVTVTDFIIRDGVLRGLKTRSRSGVSETLECDAAILAVGHSARDVFARLQDRKVAMEPKAFSVGARIEHPRALIDRAQYGAFAGHAALGAASYKLAVQLPGGRGVYTFCMCPGGIVTGAASEEGGVVTNGMSRYARDAENSNAAVLVGVTPRDFGADDVLAGVRFQRGIEQAAFRLAGGDYRAPAQRLEDFLEGRKTTAFSSVKPSYEPGVVPSDLTACLPEFVTESLRQGMAGMTRRLKGFDLPDAVLTAPETRSSSPVRILRGADLQSVSARGLYPCGEGAGYAGGILSAAVDGMKCAEMLMEAGPFSAD